VVKVLVGKRPEIGEELAGFWAEFEGEEISSYAGKGTIYTLYRCTAYDFEAYRVHIVNEADPDNPVYELHPYREDAERDPSPENPYVKPYRDYEIASEHPFFLKDIDYLPIYNIDPGPRA
jgi:hypothetical protein